MALHGHARTHTLAVERVDRTSDGAGGWLEARTRVGTVVGSLQPHSAAQQESADQWRVLARWVFYADVGVDVRRGDQLVHDDGRRFRVIDVLEWTGSRIEHTRIDLEETQRGQ